MKEVKLNNSIYYPVTIEAGQFGDLFLEQKSNSRDTQRITIDASEIPELIEFLQQQLNTPNP